VHKIANGKRNVASIFYLSFHSGTAKHAPLCMQFADFTGNIAAVALFKTNTLLLLPAFLMF
jgi:hypothetical protein